MLLLLRCSLLLFALSCTSVCSKYISDGPGVRTNVDYTQERRHKTNPPIEEPRLERHREDYSSEEIFNSAEAPATKKRQHNENEKYKCMLKYDLTEKLKKDQQQAENLKEEIGKLQDLVQILKEQQSILKILNEVGTNNLKSEKQIKSVKDEDIQDEIKKLKQDVELIKNLQSKFFKTISFEQLERIVPEEAILKNEVTQQTKEILDLKKIFNDFYKVNQTEKVFNTTKPKQNVTDMLEEINLIKSRLSELQTNDLQNDNEVVGSIFRPNLLPKINKTRNINKTRSNLARSSNTEEIDLLANLLGENKEFDSTETSFDAQNLFQILNKQGKSESPDIEDVPGIIMQLMSEAGRDINKPISRKNRLTDIAQIVKALESKNKAKSLLSEEEDEDKIRIKKLVLAIKKLSKKDKIQSKTLDDVDINSELKSLEKAIKNLQSSTDNHINLDSAEEKNLNFQFLVDKLVKPKKVNKPQLTPTQVQFLIKLLMNKKNGHHQSTTNENNYHNLPHDLNVYSYEEVDDGSLENEGYGGHGGGYQTQHLPYKHKHMFSKYGYQNPNYYSYKPNPFNQYYPNQAYNNNFEYSSFPSGNNNKYLNPYMYASENVPSNTYSNHNNKYQYSSPSSTSNIQSGYTPSNSYTSTNIYGSPIKPDYSSSKYVDNPPKSENDNFFHDTHKSYPSTNTNTASSDYGEADKSYAQNSQQSYTNTQSNSNDYTQESIKDLKYQIEELQNVINTMNKPEYTQKPSDKETVYNLNDQITDLKGAINNIHNEAISGADQSYQNTQNYDNDGNVNNDVNSGNTNQNQAENTYSGVDKSQDYTPVTRNRQGNRRHKSSRRVNRDNDENNVFSDLSSKITPDKVFKRETEDVSEEEAMEAIASLLNSAISESSETLDPNLSKMNIGDITRRVADLRKQLDHQTNLVRRRDYNNEYGNYYGIEEGKTKDKSKFKKKFKKLDIFGKVFDKILDKVVTIAIPKLLERFFGRFDLKDYLDQDSGNNYDSSYGVDYGSNYSVEKSLKGFGLSGLIPMIIFRVLSKLQYFVGYLQKYKFFRTFLVPALVLLIVAGSVIFLTWWLQPNDEYGHIDSYPSYSNNNYGYNKYYGENYKGYDQNYNGNYDQFYKGYGKNYNGNYDQNYKSYGQNYNGYGQNYGSSNKNYRSSSYSDDFRNNYAKSNTYNRPVSSLRYSLFKNNQNLQYGPEFRKKHNY